MLREAEQRLRELQARYYEGPHKNDAVILEYLRVLAEARRLSADAARAPLLSPRVHLGCGDHRLEGWINVDLAPSGAVDAVVDCAGRLPFADRALAFLHCEDLLEHVEHEKGIAMLRECFRVLRPGGVLRILTPDLGALVQKVYLERGPLHLAWCAAQLAADGPCQSLNMHLRMNGGHRFVYDEPELRRTLEEIGFRVAGVAWNRSEHPELRYLDLRDFGLNLFLEATRP
jgi:predicted SAM-dependent methyltransferase